MSRVLGSVVALGLGALGGAGTASAAPLSCAVSTICATVTLPTNSFPEFTSVDPVRGVVWTAGPSYLSETGEATQQVVQTIAFLNSPDSMTVDPRTGNVILGNIDGTLAIVNPKTQQISTVPVGNSTANFARGVAVDPTTGRIYVTDQSLSSVNDPGFANSVITIVNERTATVISQIADPNNANAVLINPRTHTVYVSNSNPGATFDKGSSVWVMNESDNQVVHRIYEPSGYPNNLALDPQTGKLFVTNQYDGPLTVINTSTNRVTAEITLGGSGIQPYGLAVDAVNGMVYVDNYGATNVWTVSESTDKGLLVTLGG